MDQDNFCDPRIYKELVVPQPPFLYLSGSHVRYHSEYIGQGNITTIDARENYSTYHSA